MTGEDDTVAIFQRELDRAIEGINSAVVTYDRLFGIGALIFGAGLTIGFQPDREVVRLLLPLPIVLLTVFGYSLFIAQMAHSGYRYHLEEQVNRRCSVNASIWESHIAQKAPHVPARAWTNRYVLPSLYIGFLSTTWVISIAASYSSNGRYAGWRPLLWFGFALSMVLVALAFSEAVRAYSSAYRAAVSYCGSNVPLPIAPHRTYEVRLQELQGLRDKGLISQEEYEDRRQAVLEGL